MATLTTQTISVATGLLDTGAALAAAASGGDSAEVGPGKFLVVLNGDASSKTVTVSTPGTVSGLAVADATYVVATLDTCIIPLAEVFRGADGRAAITYSAVTSVTVGAFELGK